MALCRFSVPLSRTGRKQLTGPTRARRGVDSLWVVLKGGTATKDHLSSEIVRTLNQFRDHLDRRYGAPGAPTIPRGSDVRPWHFSTRQFRRTVAWHIANRPFGTVAGKIQYKHASMQPSRAMAADPVRASQERLPARMRSAN